jgi:Cu/Zn superoxide dismutase
MPTGTATLSWDPTTKLITAEVKMYGFTPMSGHAMHLHPGNCAHQTQPPSVPFSDISANAAGAVTQAVTSTTASPAGIPSGSYLNIHLAPGAQLGSPTDVSFTSVACADIPAGAPAAGPVGLTMHAPSTNGQKPQGSATLAYDSSHQTLRVTVTASGLAPNTAHAVHIHSGSCSTQGDVLHPLPDLQTDAAGNGSLTTMVSNVNSPPPASGWYVNVHMGPMSQILQGNNPTLLFAPILCGDLTG